MAGFRGWGDHRRQGAPTMRLLSEGLPLAPQHIDRKGAILTAL